MSLKKKDFFANEVTEAIKDACDSFGVAQEKLDIEVVETGSNGIFGLIRKKAHIRVSPLDGQKKQPPVSKEKAAKKEPKLSSKKAHEESEKESKKISSPEPTTVVNESVSPESAEIVRQELSTLLSLVGFTSDVTTEIDGPTVYCVVSDEHEEALTGQEGKIIDSLQYLLRKLVARKVDEKVRLSIDIGQFREKRKVELMERAKELAAMVKEDGKTQAIPPLNPSERRVVHLVLQEDKEIRSRSVGGGLFKKVLIYKPGKAKKPAGKRTGRGPKKSSAPKTGQEKSGIEEKN